MKYKKTLFFIMFIIMLTACQRNDNYEIENGKAEGDYVYSSQYMRIMDYALDVYTAFDNVNNRLLINAHDSSDREYYQPEMIAVSPYGEETTEYGIDAERMENYCNMVRVGEYCYVLAKGKEGVELLKLDNELAEVKAVETEVNNIYDIAYINGFCADNEGRLYILTNYLAAVYDNELNELCSIELSGKLNRGMAACGGSVYIVENDVQGSCILSVIDIKAQQITRVDGSFPNYMINMCGDDGKIYFISSSGLYEYDIISAEVREVLCLSDYGIYGRSVAAMYMLEDNTLAMVTNESYITEGDHGLGVSLLMKIPADKDNTRQKLMIAGYGGMDTFEYIYPQIVRFTRDNPGYEVSFVNYFKEDGQGMKFDEFTKLLISGNNADVFIISDGSGDVIHNLASKGILEKLDAYLEADEELCDALIPNILNNMKIEGELFTITPDFAIRTMTGREKLVGDRSDWTVHKIMEIMEADENISFLAGVGARATLSILLNGGVCMDGEFIKKEGFESDSFIELLELSMLNGIRNQNGDSIVMDEKAIVDGLSVVVTDNDSFITLRDNYALYGEEGFVKIGYPSGSGGRSLIEWGNMFCINAASDNKTGAWTFIREFLKEDFYNCRITGTTVYPINLAVCEQQIKEWLDMQQNYTITIYSVDKSYNLIAEGDITVPVISSQQAQRIMDEINTADFSEYEIDSDIINIVLEEAEYFFDGQKTAREVAAIIQNRVQLYLDEQN